MTGADLKPRRHAAGLRHADEPAGRAHAVHGQGRGHLPGDHPARGAARPAADEPVRQRPGHPRPLRDRARPRDQVVPLDRLPPVPGRHLRLERRADHAASTSQEAKDLALVLQTGALPVKFVTLDQTAISATLGKDSLRRGEEGGADRPARRRRLPAPLLPLPRPHRRARARRLLRLPLRRDPPLQRDPDAARLRRPRPHAGGGRRRERRHLRTHQGGGARRADPCAPRSAPATRRASTRSSTRTSSPRSPPWCCSPSPPRASAASP